MSGRNAVGGAAGAGSVGWDEPMVLAGCDALLELKTPPG